jgi:hypothetical protein
MYENELKVALEEVCSCICAAFIAILMGCREILG